MSPALKGEARGGEERGGGRRGEVKEDLGLCVGAVLLRRSGAGRQVVEGGRGLLLAVAARRHPLVDAVEASRLLEALDLVLRVEALNRCEETNQREKLRGSNTGKPNLSETTGSLQVQVNQAHNHTNLRSLFKHEIYEAKYQR